MEHFSDRQMHRMARLASLFDPNNPGPGLGTTRYLCDLGVQIENMLEIDPATIRDPKFKDAAVEEHTDRKEMMKKLEVLRCMSEEAMALGYYSIPDDIEYMFYKPMGPAEFNKLKPKLQNPKNRVNIVDLTKSIDQRLKGKYFLCRTIASPHITPIEDQFTVVVDDPEGVYALVLLCSLHDDPKGKSPEEFLPIGTVMLIKDPRLSMNIVGGGVSLYCHSTKNLLIVSREMQMQYFSEIGWGFELRPEVMKEIKAELAIDFKDSGNQAFAEKGYFEALQDYSHGLRVEPYHVDLLGNRAACYLKLRCYSKSLADSEKVLELKPSHVKCIYRKVKALWGLQRYEDALKFLDHKMLANPDLKKISELVDLHSAAKKILYQNKTGKGYNLMAMLENEMQAHDVGEYTGNIKVSSILDNNNAQKLALIATEDIQPGQLILCQKAFSIYFTGPQDNMEAVCDSNGAFFNEGITVLYRKLKLEPEHKEQVLSLYQDECAKHEGSKKGKRKLSEDESLMEKITTIYRNYSCRGHGTAHSSPFTSVFGGEMMTRMLESGISYGLWILESYIGDGCYDSNASVLLVGDVIFIRATKYIKKGDAVLIQHQNMLVNYLDRKASNKINKRHCRCQLCSLDAQDSDATHQLRKGIRKSLMSRFFYHPGSLAKKGSKSDVGVLIKWIENLRALRPDHPKLNIQLIIPINFLAEIFCDFGDYSRAATLWKEAYSIVEHPMLGRLMVRFSACLVECYIQMDRLNEAEEWTKILMKNLTIFYGCLDIVKYFEADTYERMESVGLTMHSLKL